MARRVFANFRLLFSGRVVAALLNLGALATLARALQLGEFGTVVLVHTYVLTMRGILNVRPSLAIVRWGVPLLERGERGPLLAVLQLTRRIDRCMALGATALAALLAPVAGELLGWNASIVPYATLYSAALLFSGIGTARGYLQLTDRFDLLAQQMTVGPAIRLTGALTANWLAPRIEVFLAIWSCSLAIEYLFLTWRARRQCSAAGLRLSWLGGGSFTAFPGMPRFLLTTYIQSLLEMAPNRFATLLVGGSLGAASAGLFRAAQDCATAVTRPAILLRQAVFPDLTRLWHENYARFRRLIVRVSFVAGSIGLGLAVLALLAGDHLLGALFGPQFAAARVLLAWLMLGAAFDLGGAAMTPAGYAMDRAGHILTGRAIATLVLVAGYLLLQQAFGLNGIGMAISAASVTFWIALVLVVSGAPPGGAPAPGRAPR